VEFFFFFRVHRFPLPNLISSTAPRSLIICHLMLCGAGTDTSLHNQIKHDYAYGSRWIVLASYATGSSTQTNVIYSASRDIRIVHCLSRARMSRRLCNILTPRKLKRDWEELVKVPVWRSTSWNKVRSSNAPIWTDQRPLFHTSVICVPLLWWKNRDARALLRRYGGYAKGCKMDESGISLHFFQGVARTNSLRAAVLKHTSF
jgi:hypothetical protein